MIEVFDKTRRRVAILENAYAASESQKINSVWYFYFSLPYGDSKNEYCKPFYYVRPDGGELYRIMPETLSVSESGGISYQCEHVLATLIDNVLFGYHVVGNLGVYTADVIRYILDHQLVKNWVLDECDFRNQFEYGWEQESLLSALFSVLSPLSSPMIVTDTTVYPWRLSLKKLVTTGRPEMYVRRRYNMTSYTRGRDPQNIVTRLYPLGYGEGINQLNIKGVNDGVPYIQSPKEITDKYGIIERVWIDRRYEDAASLKAAAEIMLSELQEPLVSYSVGFHELTASDYDKAAIGKRVRIIFPEVGDSVDTYITELTRKRDDLKESTITVANRETSIAASLADMADRQRIQNRIVRDHGIVDDALFHTLLRDGHNGVAGGLRPGAAGGGHQYQLLILHDLGLAIVEIQDGGNSFQCKKLGNINDGTAAADRYDQIARHCLQLPGDFLYIQVARLPRYIVQHRIGNICQLTKQHIAYAGLPHTLIGEHDNLFRVLPANNLRDNFHTALP